jgi:hypothetical protein
MVRFQSCGFQLLLAGLVIALSLLQLTGRYLVEAHADKIVWINLRDGVGFFDQFEAAETVRLALVGIRLVLRQVQVMASEHVHCSDSFLFVFEEVALLLHGVDAIVLKSFSKYL